MENITKGYNASLYGILCGESLPDLFGELIEGYDIGTETHAEYLNNGRRAHIDNNGCIVLEVIKPLTCINFSAFENTCIPECCTCNDPYNCKLPEWGPVLHSNYRKTQQDIKFMCVFEFSLQQCTSIHCNECKNKVSCDMCLIAAHMVVDGRY